MRDWTLLAVMLMVLAATTVSAQSKASFVRVNDDFMVGASPVAVAAGDVDGDHKIDLVTANNDEGDVSVLSGDGHGSFSAPGINYPIGDPDLAAPSALTIADMNKDTLPDIVVTDEVGNTVSVLINQGGGVFGNALITDTGSGPESVVVADFNGDGNPDVATADILSDTVTVLLGSGDGHFTDPSLCSSGAETPCICSNQLSQSCAQSSDCPTGGVCSLHVGSEPAALIAQDLDGDGKIDLIVANSSEGPDATGTLRVLKGAGNGSFVPQPDITSTTFNVPLAMTLADVDHNSIPDLIVANSEGDTVSVLLGNGGFTFQTATFYDVGGYPDSIATGDFDADGNLDIATSASFDDKVSVLFGNGDGTFFSAQDVETGVQPNGVATADFDGDGRADFATANTDDDTVSVLLSRPPVAMCAGDCNMDGFVTVDDLLTMTNIGLDNAVVTECTFGDANSDGHITVDEILKAVNHAFSGCMQQ